MNHASTEFTISGLGWVSTAGMGCGTGSNNGIKFGAFADGELAPIQRKDLLDRPDRGFGRMDQFSRLGLAGITLALRDAGLEHSEHKRSIGVLAETATGCLYTDSDYFATVVADQGQFASPQLFAYTLANTFLGEAALRLKLTGNCQVVNNTSGDSLAMVRMALESIAWGEEETMVVGYCDLTAQGALQAPGALFMLVEQLTPKTAQSSFKVSLTAEGSVRCNDKVMSSLHELINILAAH
jgi:3-oxoacyl-[acyl-carrier-protein] synthase II